MNRALWAACIWGVCVCDGLNPLSTAHINQVASVVVELKGYWAPPPSSVILVNSIREIYGHM